jgi:V/A-type H+-transporting ATPase subunit I
MRSSSVFLPVRMSRVAIVAPRARLRTTLVEVADAGDVELAGSLPAAEGEEVEAQRRLEHELGSTRSIEPRLSVEPPNLQELEQSGALDLIAGEVELRRREKLAIEHGSFAALVGWTPTSGLDALNQRLTARGGIALELPRPAWVDPPTLFSPRGVARPFRFLVDTYGIAPYADVDPTPFAAVSFVLMFGMMFGDVGHGLLLALLGLLLRWGRLGPASRFHALWPLPVAAGASGAIFGALYGEMFGPTHLVPTLWLKPVDRPGPLLFVAVAVGAAFLAIGHAYGIVNRWREAGVVEALVAQSGVAGLALLVGLIGASVGWYTKESFAEWVGGVSAGVGVVLLGGGFLLSAGRGFAAATQAAIELVDALVRTASNTVSFTRLAAFGLMHAALGSVVFQAASASWGGVGGSLAAVAVFLVGNAVAFSLELLVTSVQALRLEFYELFSRVFAGQGHPFSPWRIPVALTKEEP